MAHPPRALNNEVHLLLQSEVDVILEAPLVKVGSTSAQGQAWVTAHAAIVELRGDANSAVHRPLLSLI